jgi:hypothetical protein
MAKKYKDPGYPGPFQVAETLRVGGMAAIVVNSSEFLVVAGVSTGYVTLNVEGFEIAESIGDPLNEVLEVIDALRVGGIQALRYWGPDSDTVYVNTILTDQASGMNSISVSLGWPS